MCYLLIINLLVFGGNTMAVDDLGKVINIALLDEEFVVGGSIPLTIVYINRGNDTISFREPAKTWEVMLNVVYADEEKEVVSFGRIFHKKVSGGIERTTIEDAETITLKNNEQYKFSYDISKRWPALFPPGKHLFFVLDRSDDAKTHRSNTVEICVYFDVSSISNLLGIVADKDISLDAGSFAVSWIRKFYPGFTIYLETPTEEQRVINKKIIQEFKTWWKANKNTEHVRNKIAEINTTAGLQ